MFIGREQQECHHCEWYELGDKGVDEAPFQGNVEGELWEILLRIIIVLQPEIGVGTTLSVAKETIFNVPAFKKNSVFLQTWKNGRGS